MQIDTEKVRNYVETTTETTLADYYTESQFNRLRALASSDDADVVVILAGYGNTTCGRANAILTESASDSLVAVNYSCAAANLSLAHEIGHIQGAEHNTARASSSPPFSYGHGWLDEDVGYSTIMAYAHDCDPDCTRKGIWSDPYDSFIGSADPAGTENQEWNAKVLFATGEYIASLRGDDETYDSVAPTGGITLPSTSVDSGTIITISATFNEDIHDDYPPKITISDGTTSTTSNMAKSSSTVYTNSHTLTDEQGTVNLSFSDAKDLFGNDIVSTPTSGSSFSVIAPDTTAPTITASSDKTFEATGTSTTITASQLGTATATDDQDSSPTITNDAPSTFPLGATTVTWTATDSAGNSSTDTQTVTIQDTTAPALTTPGDKTFEATAVSTPLNSTNYGMANATDVTDADPVITNNATATFSLGNTTITWSATDYSNNTSTADQTITIQDTIAPLLSIPLDYITEAIALITPLNSTDYGTANATDIFAFTINNNSNGDFTLGNNTITWSATDTSGNVASVNQTIIIQDTTAPVFTGTPPNFTTEATAFLTLLDSTNYGMANATDIFPVTISNDSDGSFALGNSTLTWNATDTSGNTASANQTITIVDTTTPTINVDSFSILEATAVLTPLNATDYVFPAVTDNHSTSLSHDGPAAFPLGNTTVTWTVSDDSGNTASANQTITIQDTTPPTLVDLITPYLLEATAALTPVNSTSYVPPTVTDSYDVSPTLTSNIPTVLPLGDTTVVWTSSDSIGNSVSANQTITIQDTISPIITAPADYTVSLSQNQTSIALNSTDYGTATATDIFAVTITNNAPSTFSLGNSTITWDATDTSGNFDTANQTITVTAFE